MKPPPRIYKYEQFNVQSLQNLKSQIIYFASPRKFNDPYDCALKPSIEPPMDAEVEDVRARYIARANMPAELRAQFEKMSVDQLREILVRSSSETVQRAVDHFLDTNGVTCFSETPDNLLMWSHYAGKSQGFCLEFDTTSEPFDRLLKVTYSEKIPSLAVTSDLLLGSPNSKLIEKLYCTKSKDWEYEREWRAIHVSNNISYCYPAKNLTGVYFGPDSTGPSQEIVCLVLLGQNENVRFYQGMRSASEFKVEFKEFTYTPNLIAKKAGLLS